MYKPDPARLAKFWSTFQVRVSVRCENWCCQKLKTKLLLRRRGGPSMETVFQQWQPSLDTGDHDFFMIIWLTHFTNASTNHLFMIIKLTRFTPSPAGGCVLAMSCDYRVTHHNHNSQSLCVKHSPTSCTWIFSLGLTRPLAGDAV